MKRDYLWDGSGESDPEIQRLENLLRPLRYDGAAPIFPEIPVAKEQSRWYERLRRRMSWQLAFGVTAVMAIAIILASRWAVRNGKPFYEVVSLKGIPSVNSSPIGNTGRLRTGQWLETDGSSRARIRIGEIGQVEIEPNTRIRLELARATDHRLSLELGILHALIWAPPGQFSVDIPSARAVDLGCAYTLKVNDDGTGLLHVTAGWVAFESNGHESFVPAGAMCLTRPGQGAGTPHQEDASPRFRAALEELDFRPREPEATSGSLGVVLSEARKRDALSLWHLLARRNTERSRIYDRLVQLIPPPPGVTREGIIAGRQEMLDLWWNQLGLGDTQFWRRWERPYPIPK